MIAVDTNTDLESILIMGEKSILLTPDDLESGSNYILIKLPVGDYHI
ncbi:hypothetical protein [Teredinibacter purpureus]|nr:hypothetical protein [Teredinibacter purpureus]